MNYYLCFFSCIIFLNCFVNNTIVNSCGKVGSERPQSKDDCKSDDSDNCCYIQVPEKDMKHRKAQEHCPLEIQDAHCSFP